MIDYIDCFGPDDPEYLKKLWMKIKKLLKRLLFGSKEDLEPLHYDLKYHEPKRIPYDFVDFE